MKRAEAYVGQAVYVGGTRHAGTWARAVVVGLDCGDNGYRVGLAVEQRSGTWLYGQWPLHSVHTEEEYERAAEAHEAQLEAANNERARREAVLAQMRADATFIAAYYGCVVVVVPEPRSGAHYARLDANGLRAIAGAAEA